MEYLVLYKNLDFGRQFILEWELASDRLAVLDVESFPIMRHWYLVHRSSKRFTALSLAFKQLVIEDTATILKT